MGTLKDVMKTAKNLLKDGKNEEVVELLKVPILNGVKDYELFCFAGLANFNASKFETAYEVFKMAIQLDDAKPIAWKGIYKLFENETKVNADQFSLIICEKMKSIVDGDEKRNEIQKTYRRLVMELKDWEKILADFDCFNDDNIIHRVLNEIDIEKGLSKTSSDLVRRCYETLQKNHSLTSEVEIFKKFCRFLLKIQDNSLKENILKLCELYPQASTEKWISPELLTFACEEYFTRGTFPKFVETVKFEKPKINAIISNLRENDTTSALEVLDSMPSSSKIAYPESMLFVELLANAENWSECEQVVKSIAKNSKSSSVLSYCNGWIARVVLEDGQDAKKLTTGLPLPEFLREEAKRLLFMGESGMKGLSSLFKEYSEDSKEFLIIELISALHNKSVRKEHAKKAEMLLALNGADWKDILLAAEIKSALKLDATPLLVKAAKLNPRSSRVFYVLGRSLATKNPVKAKSCLERAVKIQPTNSEYYKELDNVLKSQNASAKDRLANLKLLVNSNGTKRKSAWLSETLAVLYLETDNLDGAIEELQKMVRFSNDNKLAWARLAQAYFKKGHLRAAVSSYEHLSQIEGGHEYTIPMIRVLVQLRDFEISLEKIGEYRESTKNLKTTDSSKIAIDALEAQIRLNLIKTTTGEARKIHLKESLKVLAKCVAKKTNFSIVYKLAGDALLKVVLYSDRFLDFFEIDSSWNVSNRLSCIQAAMSFYSVVLRLRKDDPLAWHDISVALLTAYKLEKIPEQLEKAQKFIKHGLQLTKNELTLSTFWTLLAEALRLSDAPPSHQLHCLTRALQLNKTNDVAWLQLAILCVLQTEMNAASRALEQAIKYHSQNSDAWCAWAQHAHLQDQPYDALVMFRQALCIQPTASAVAGYSGYLCDDLKKKPCRFDCATVALDFEPVIELRDMACCDEETLYQLGLLADFFGYYKEALECFQRANRTGDVVERVKMKLGVISPNEKLELSTLSSANMRLALLLPFNKSELLAFLTNEISIYAQLFDCIERNDIVSFRSLYVANIKNISVPLFVSAIIALDIDLPIGCVATMHEALPRHELIDYFPTILPEGMDNGLRHLENDGEKPFRYRHHVAEELLDELKALKEKYEALNVIDVKPEVELAINGVTENL